VFEDATTGVCVFHFMESNMNPIFPCRIHYDKDTIQECTVELHPEYNWLTGQEFFEYINVPDPGFKRWTGKEHEYLTSMVLGLLDYGKYNQGLTYNTNSPVICADKAFTTYQIVSPFNIPDSLQKGIVEVFNNKMGYFREKYHGLFLSNYMGANQKIYSRSYMHKLLYKIYTELT
jgi:hypothetical protein